MLHPAAHAALERLGRRYANLKRLAGPCTLTATALYIIGLTVRDSASPARAVALVWASLLMVAALWQRVPPAFAAPDLYRRISRSMDPIESASEWDEQVTRMTRFGLAIAATWVLVANDLLREARLRFIDEVSAESSGPADQQATEYARAAASNSWFIFGFCVLGAAIVHGVARRLHAVDEICYATCRELSDRRQPRERWYVLLTAIALAAAAGLTFVTGSLLAQIA